MSAAISPLAPLPIQQKAVIWRGKKAKGKNVYPLVIDISKWDGRVNWDILHLAGVEGVWIKATQGNYKVDPRLAENVADAHKVGKWVGLFHWNDPLVDPVMQAEYFLKTANKYEYNALAVDVEQQWADWQEWQDGKITQLINPNRISYTSAKIISVLETRTAAPVVIYTRGSFIWEYARPMINWIGEKQTWYAQYPYKKGIVECTWDELKEKWIPLAKQPSWPKGYPEKCKSWNFWQFTGDKFILPGVKAKLDVNFWNGTVQELWALKRGDTPRSPQVENIPGGRPIFMTYTGKVTAILGLRIRNIPGGDRIGVYPYGSRVSILEVKNGWGRTEHGWVSLDYIARI